MASFRAARPGTLPKTEDAVLEGVKLPSGRLISPAESDEPSSAPVLWITKEPVAPLGPLFRAVAAGFATHGLWPLVLESFDSDDARPWLCGELDPSMSTSPDEHDAKAILEKSWARVIPVAEEEPQAFAALAPFARDFPGLAPASESKSDEKVLDAVVAGMRGRLGLVAVARPADVLAVLGWMGPLNHHSDMGELGAVLRSWEDRFGAILVGVGFATLTLAVHRRPRTAKLATEIAAEHFAMCSDNVYQGAGSIEAYATSLRRRNVWTFWWD